MKSRVLAMFSCLAALTAAGAFAQSSATWKADIPFAFRVGGTVLPAGHYEVRPQTNPNLLSIRSYECKAGTMIVANAVRTPTPAEKDKLVFNRYGNVYFLSEVWTAGSEGIAGYSQGRQLPTSKAERELARDGSPTPTVIVAIVQR